MSKNTRADKFRRVNVDDYDENNYVDEEEGGENQLGPDEAEVDASIRQYPFLCEVGPAGHTWAVEAGSSVTAAGPGHCVAATVSHTHSLHGKLASDFSLSLHFSSAPGRGFSFQRHGFRFKHHGCTR